MDFDYVVKSSLNTDKPILLLNKHIGYDEVDGMGIDGAKFQRELLELDGMGKKAIEVWINSPGGVVMDGYSIFNAILKSNTPVDTFNTGIAASIAGVIFMAGRKRVMADYASLMMHNPHGTDDKKQLGAMQQSIATMLSSRSALNSVEVSYLMEKTSWLNAAECFSKGFCTSIEATSAANKKHIPALTALASANVDEATPTKVKAAWEQAGSMVNSFLHDVSDVKNNVKINKMDKVTNKLGLVTGASEDTILAAIEANETALNSARQTLTSVQAKLTTAEARVTELEAAETAAATALAAETERAEGVAIDAVLDKAVASGRIDAKAKTAWQATGKTVGLDQLKDLVENIPLNVTGKKLDPVTNGGDGLKNVAGKAMAAVRDKLGL